MRKIYADLHNHSTASDGTFSPAGIVDEAIKKGIRALALTDHDTIGGLKEFREAAAIKNIQPVLGIEITLRFKRPAFTGSLHLLVYFRDKLLDNREFEKDLNALLQQGRGKDLVERRVAEINKVFGPQTEEPILKKPLTVEEILPYSPQITRRHFFMALSEKHNISDKQTINRLIGNDSPAYIPSGIDMEMLPGLLNKYPLFRVLAHPAAGSFPGDSHYKEVLPPLEIVESMLPEFLDETICGLDGLEVYYPGHTDEHKKHLLELANKHQLVVTGGSDCHDPENRPLATDGLTEPEFDRFIESLP
jgi:3',5'-nucleoside bisphosphate phosphatase